METLVCILVVLSIGFPSAGIGILVKTIMFEGWHRRPEGS